jgi:hypothetical protein
MLNDYSDPYGSRKRFRRLGAIIGLMIGAAIFLHDHDFAMKIGAEGVTVCLPPDGCASISLSEIFRAWSLGEAAAEGRPAAAPETDDDNPTIEI